MTEVEIQIVVLS